MAANSSRIACFNGSILELNGAFSAARFPYWRVYSMNTVHIPLQVKLIMLDFGSNDAGS